MIVYKHNSVSTHAKHLYYGPAFFFNYVQLLSCVRTITIQVFAMLCVLVVCKDIVEFSEKMNTCSIERTTLTHGA